MTRYDMADAMRNVIDEQREDITALKAENAKMRHDLEEANNQAEEVCIENTKLREERREYQATIDSLVDECADHKADNAKLRELCADMNKAAHMLCEAWEGSCSKEAEGMSLYAVCPIGDTNELCVFGRLYDQVRELGVEAD